MTPGAMAQRRLLRSAATPRSGAGACLSRPTERSAAHASVMAATVLTVRQLRPVLAVPSARSK